jgi:hypothetical protein
MSARKCAGVYALSAPSFLENLDVARIHTRLDEASGASSKNPISEKSTEVSHESLPERGYRRHYRDDPLG